MPVYVDPDNVQVVKATIPATPPVLVTSTTQNAATAPTLLRLAVGATLAITTPTVDRGSYRGPAALVIVNVGTGSPTVNVDIQGSVDGVLFYNIAYALVATPNTVAVAQIAITTTANTTYLLVTDQAWRYLKVVTSTVATETYSITYYQ